MRDIALKLDIPLWRLPFVYFKGRRKMRAHMESVKAFDGMIEVVKRLKKDHNNLYIISSNAIRLMIVLDRFGAVRVFWGRSR
jgi:phosphoglycolate phosphatase-like HAD superfamily hydrolase